MEGRFRKDGSWAANGHGDPQLTYFVDMLATAVKRGYTPQAVVQRIERDGDQWVHAFPHVADWAKAKSWHVAPARTSAEQTVRSARP